MSVLKFRNGILALLVAVAAFSSGGCGGGGDSDVSMDRWKGSWKSESGYLKDSGMNEAYSAVASHVSGVSSEDVKGAFEAMLYSSIDSIKISGGAAVLISNGGAVSYDYSLVGTTPIPGFDGSVWNKFESEQDGPFKYLIVTEVHSDGPDAMKHWHFRYGASGFDSLVSGDNSLWWPTFVAADTSIEKVAKDMNDEAEAMAQFLSSSPSLSGWDGDWKSFSSYLDDPAMDSAYEAIAAKGKNLTAAEVETALKNMYDSKGVTALSIRGDVITVTSGGGSMAYDYEGRMFAPISGFDGVFWYKFEAPSASDQRYMVMTSVHSDGPDAMKHWHVRFGDAGFSALADRTDFWYPTFVESSTEVSDIASDFLAEADELAAMITALK